LNQKGNQNLNSGNKEKAFNQFDKADKLQQRRSDIREKAGYKKGGTSPSAGLSKKQKSSVAKKATAGKDIGKKGKMFAKIAKKAGGGEKGKKIAAAAMWKNIKRG
jgi:hypothetical protein